MTTPAADPAGVPARPTLTNQRLAISTMLAAQDAGPDSSTRLCLLYGHSGYGKSVAAATVAARLSALYYEAKAVVTVRALLEGIADEMGLPDKARTSARLFDQIVRALSIDPRPIILDEADYLVKKQLVDVIRDIHDAAPVSIMLIGEEALPAKLKAWERFDNRIIAATPAQPATIDDARLLRDHYCARVGLADDLVGEIVGRTRGVTRRIVANLTMVQAAALDEGRIEVDLAWWQLQRRPFLTGELPARRKAA